MAPNDQHQLDYSVHRTLLIGLVVSGALLAAGLAMMLVQGHEQAAKHEPLMTLLRDAARLHGPSVTTLGLLALMITPILRVVVLLVGWTIRRNWRFAGVAMAVLLLLCISLGLGAR